MYVHKFFLIGTLCYFLISSCSIHAFDRYIMFKLTQSNFTYVKFTLNVKWKKNWSNVRRNDKYSNKSPYDVRITGDKVRWTVCPGGFKMYKILKLDVRWAVRSWEPGWPCGVCGIWILVELVQEVSGFSQKFDPFGPTGLYSANCSKIEF